MSLTILDFHADWCGPCKQQEPILQELLEAYDGHLELKKIDIEQEDEMVNKHGIQSVPTLVLLNEEEEIEDRFVGVQSLDTLESAVKNSI